MRILIGFFLLFSLGCCLSAPSPAAAAGEDRLQHLPTGKILEFSLSSLKESLEKINQKNERLAFENEMLRKSIHDLQREKEFLLGKKDSLSGTASGFERDRKILRPLKSADLMAREKRTSELIDIFQRDIERLKDEIRVLEGSLSGEGFHARQQMLFDEIRKTEKDLIRVGKKLKLLEQKNEAPKKKIEVLQKEQRDLVQEIKRLEQHRPGF